jgi:hypothetical protein
MFFVLRQVTKYVPTTALVGTYLLNLLTARNMINLNFTFGET